MKLINQTNSWGCFITSAAMVLDESVEQLIQELGHDGSEIVAPDVRKGLHYQEFIDLAIKRGFTVTTIEYNPESENYPTGLTWEVIPEEKRQERFHNHLLGHRGIICGLKKTNYHAVAIDIDGKIYDPGKRKVTDLEHIDIQLDYFLRVDKIISK